MATIILDNAFISIGGNDLSAHVKSVKLNYEREVKDETAMGDNTRVSKAALKNWSLNVTFNQDFSNGSLDDLLFAAADAGTAVAIIVRPDTATAGVNNPQYGGTGIITSYPPFGNGVGDLAETSVDIVPGGASPDLVRVEA